MSKQFFNLSLITLLVLTFFVFYFIPKSSFSENNISSHSPLNDVSNIDGNITIYLLSTVIEKDIEKVSSILDIASKIPDVKNTPYSNFLNESLKIYNGIPEDQDLEKRQIFKNILSKYRDISAITLLMPNGDVYAEEPFALQENLTSSNFAFRDYFKGANDSKNMFMGDLIKSAATGLPITVLAVPIYSDDDKNQNNLTGMLLGIFDFTYLNKFLQSLDIPESEKILLLDHLGNIIADSSGTNEGNQSAVFSKLQSFQNAILGGSGSTIENVNHTKMIISYYPIKSVQNTWAILWMKSYEDMK